MRLLCLHSQTLDEAHGAGVSWAGGSSTQVGFAQAWGGGRDGLKLQALSHARTGNWESSVASRVGPSPHRVHARVREIGRKAALGLLVRGARFHVELDRDESTSVRSSSHGTAGAMITCCFLNSVTVWCTAHHIIVVLQSSDLGIVLWELELEVSCCFIVCLSSSGNQLSMCIHLLCVCIVHLLGRKMCCVRLCIGL